MAEPDPGGGGRIARHADHDHQQHVHSRDDEPWSGKVRALRSGADDYLIKPFHPAELMARMKSLIARFQPTESLVGRPPWAGSTPTTVPRAASAPRRSRSTRPSHSIDLGRSVCLVDGNLQFGDHRVFLDLGLDRKSIVDLVSTPSMDADLVKSIVIKHDSGVDLLLAPPSPEAADLVTATHLHQVLDLLSGLYDYVIVDIDKRLEDRNLMVLDVASTIFAVMTADLSCLKNVRLVLETIGHLGYEQSKLSWSSTAPTPTRGSASRAPRVPCAARSSCRW